MYDAMIFVINAPILQKKHPMLHSWSAPYAILFLQESIIVIYINLSTSCATDVGITVIHSFITAIKGSYPSASLLRFYHGLGDVFWFNAG